MQLQQLLQENYEKNQYFQLAAWKTEEPGVIAKVTGTVFKPVSWLMQSIIPEKSLQAGIETCHGASKSLLDAEGFKRENNIATIAELKSKTLEFCDATAEVVHNWAIGIAAGEGALTGATGILGMAADVPAIVTIAFRTVNKIAMCYGFENNSEEEDQRVLGILSASGANTMAEKQQALFELEQLQLASAKDSIKRTAEKTVTNEATKIAIRALAKQLGMNLTRRKALQVVPVLGAAVGASVNGSFINDVAWTARRVYQEAWLAQKYTPEKA